MKPSTISAEALFEVHREAMHWQWIAGHGHPERHFDDNAVRDARSAADDGTTRNRRVVSDIGGIQEQ